MHKQKEIKQNREEGTMHKQLVVLRIVIMSVVILGLLLAACQVSSTPVPTPAGPAAAPTSPPPKAVQVAPTPLPTPVAPAAAPTSPPSKTVGELVVAVDNFGWEVLFPPLGNSALKLHASLMYDYLVGVDRKGAKLDPTTGIAKRWEESADGLTWTFWLREGIKFHNGEDLTAEDVKFSLERNTSAKSLASNAAALRGTISSIDVEDPYRLKIRLKKRDWSLAHWLSPFLTSSEGMVYPKKYVTEKGDDYVAEHPVGSGPYRFEKWLSGNLITYKAVEKHWLVGAPKYDRITFRLVPEESSRIAMLETGQAQIIIGVSPQKSKGLRDKFRVFVKEAENIFAVRFQQLWTTGNPLGNEKVREALGLALNKQEMVEHILYGAGKVTGSYPMPAWAPGYQPLEPVPYDPEKAKRLLKEAGYGPGDLKLNIYLFERPGTAAIQKLSTEAAAAYWEAVGVKSNIIAMDYAAFRPILKIFKLADPALMVAANQARYVHPFKIWYHSEGESAQIHDPQADSLVGAVEASPDEKTYGAAAAALTRYIREHNVDISIFEMGQAGAASKEIGPWEIGARNFDYNLVDLYWR